MSGARCRLAALGPHAARAVARGAAAAAHRAHVAPSQPFSRRSQAPSPRPTTSRSPPSPAASAAAVRVGALRSPRLAAEAAAAEAAAAAASAAAAAAAAAAADAAARQDAALELVRPAFEQLAPLKCAGTPFEKSLDA